MQCIYFSVRDDTDNGAIIDFVQHRRRCALGAVRQVLRSWIAGAFTRPALEPFVPEVVPVSRDRAGVLRALSGMKPRELLAHPRFAGRILVEARSNVIFPYADQDGLCGYEIKNRDVTGFAPGDEKGLWVSGVERTDTARVIAKSDIEALS